MILSFHNKKSLKAATVRAMKADIKAERLVPGHYWNGKNGCFVGCVIRGDQHRKFEDVLGIPRILARLGDRLYEGMKDRALQQKFAVDFLEAIPVGVDLSGVWDKFAHFMLVDAEYGVIKFAKTDKTKKSIQGVADMYARKINGEKIDANEWLAVKKNAYADAAAAYAAAAADAADAAAAAAYAAAAAADAADAAAYADAAADAAAYADAAAADAAAAAAAAAYADAAAAYAYAAADAYAAARSRHFAALATCLLNLFRAAGKKLAA